LGENRKPTSPEIKRRARILGLVYSNSIVDVSRATSIVRAFCKTMSRLELRDDDSDNWAYHETTIFNVPEIYEYLKLVEKSRKKPKRKK